MIDITLFQALFCFFIGLFVGLFYFGGLWWTIKKIQTSQGRVGKILFVSWLIRNGVFISIFYWVMDGHYQRLLIAFLGMMSVRLCSTLYIKRQNKKEGVL